MSEFYKENLNILSLDPKTNTKEILLNHWIKKEVYLERQRGRYPEGYFEMSNRSVAEALGINTSSVYRTIKKLETLNVIARVHTAKGKHEKSVYVYKSCEKRGVSNVL